MRLFLGFLLLLCGVSFAQTPTITGISGGTSDGETLTITGTNFGTHPVRYSFLGGPDGVTDSDSLRDAANNHIDHLHALGMQGWQTQSYQRSGGNCDNDTTFITRLRANEQVRANRKTSIVTRMNVHPPGGTCYTNGWYFHRQNKRAGSGTRPTPWWTTDTLTTRSWYVSWWQYTDIAAFDTTDANPGVPGIQRFTADKIFGPGTHYTLNSGNPYIGNTYHAGAGHFWATIGWNPSSNITGNTTSTSLPASRTAPMDIYATCIAAGAACVQDVTCPQRNSSGLECYQSASSCSNCVGHTNCNLPTQGLTYTPWGRWVRHEVYVRANRDSSQGATTEFEGVFQWKFQSPGLAEQCMANYGPTTTVPPDKHIVTHAWEWRTKALIDNECDPYSGPMATWNKWAMWRFINFAQSTEDIALSFDDVYLQADTRSRVMIANNAVFANATHKEIAQIISWSQTQIVIKVNRGAIPITDPFYVFVIKETGNGVTESVSLGQQLVDVTVETVLPTTANTGVPFWADFWVRGNTPWRAAAFKVYYDSTRVIPIRYAYHNGDSRGCVAEFDDKITQQPKIWSRGADADIWINYDKGAGTATTDDVKVGRIQFLPVGSGFARIQTSPSNREGHYSGGAGVNFGCMPYFTPIDQVDSEAIILTNANGTSYVTPASTDSWTTIIDSVNVSGAASDRCVGNWSDHPPKFGLPVAGSICAPFAAVFSAQDSSVSSLTDTLKITMSVWADSVRSIQGYIEYQPFCTDSTSTNAPVSVTLAPGVGFNQLEVDLDYENDPTKTIPFDICSDDFPPGIPAHRPKFIYFKASRSDQAQVSVSGALLKINIVSPDPCQDEFEIGLPCQEDDQVVYSSEFVSMVKFNFSRDEDTAAQARERGKVYVNDIVRYGWISPLYLYLSNLHYGWE